MKRLAHDDIAGRFGFVPAADFRLEWPGFIEPERLQLYELVGGSLEGLPKTSLAVRGIAPSD